MKTKYLIFSFWLLICVNPSITNGQTFGPKIISYPNGNSLIEGNGSYELKSKNGNTIGIWNSEGALIQIQQQPYKRIFRGKNSYKKEGLFNPDSGLLTVEPLYDGITPSQNDNGIILTKIGKKFGMAHTKGYVFIPAIHDGIYIYPNEKYLLKRDTTAYLINERLETIDSVNGFKRAQYIYYANGKEYVFAIISENGMSLIDKDGKVVAFNKDWTNVFEEISGHNLIISSNNGFGLYNLISKVTIEPCKYKTFRCKPFFNEQILFSEKDRWTLFDSSGKQILVVKADSVMPALDEWSGFFFKKMGKWGFIDLTGKILRQPIWKSISNPRFDNFEASFGNQTTKNYYYEYKQVNGRLIISEVKEGVSTTLPR